MLAIILAGVLTAVATALSAVAINVATGGDAPWFPTMEDHPLRWTAISVPSLALGAWLLWWTQRGYESSRATLIPAAPPPEPWMVDRPRELTAIVRALRRRRGVTVGITTAVHGAGGFGKTTIARMVRADARVSRHFGRRVYWVTLGRDARRGALVEKINDLVKQIDPARAQPFTDVRQAADHLAAVLAAGPRRLIILDDVWDDDQLAAFPVAGRSARLVTTRVATLVAGGAIPVKVDRMSPVQSRRVLTADLPQPLPPEVIDGLLAEAGSWPLLLRLVNKLLLDQTRSHTDVAAAGRGLLARLRREGPLSVDRLTGVVPEQLDVNKPEQRDKAIGATIEAGAGLLTTAEQTRFAELSIFVEDEVVPVALVAALWQATGALDETETRRLCARLADLALLTLIGTAEGGTIGLHDVVRDYLADGLGGTEIERLHGVLLDTARVTPWWHLPDHSRYLRDHLVEHLLSAGRADEAAAVATDLRWVATRLEDNGPAAPAADLSLIDTPKARRLNELLQQTAHLLAPTEPPGARLEILFDRVAHDEDWGALAAELQQRSALSSVWPLPDLPDPALRRAFTGRTAGINALAIAPDATWLVSGGEDGVLRLWDPESGREIRQLGSHKRGVTALAVSADGGSVASGSADGSVRLWDVPTGRLRTAVKGHPDKISAVAISPDGSWVATGSITGTVSLWHAGTGRPAARLITAPSRTIRRWHRIVDRIVRSSFHRIDGIVSIFFAPGGATVTAVAYYGTVSTWDVATRQRRGAFESGRWLTAAAASPDGTLLVTTGGGRQVTVWDTRTGEQIGVIDEAAESIGYTPTAVVVTSDGSSVVIAGQTGLTHVCDVSTGRETSQIRSHASHVTAVAAASGAGWIATAGVDGFLRTWNPDSRGEHPRESALDLPTGPISVAPDGSWLAQVTSDPDSTLRLWHPDGPRYVADLFDDQIRCLAVSPRGDLAAAGGRRVWIRWSGGETSEGDVGQCWAMAFAGDWLALTDAGGEIVLKRPGTLRTWQRLNHHKGEITAIVAAPSGEWLASAGHDTTVRLWNPETGEQLARLSDHAGRLHALAAAPDATWLASAGDDGTIRLWDPAAHRLLARLVAGVDMITALAATPDSRFLASGSYDGAIRVWDVAARRVIALTRVDGLPASLAWHPDGRRLFLGGYGGVYCFALQPTKIQNV
ncbi:WD40 repeat protein [Actinoplanes lutulentus]|nr:NB-ARC domain-containing protein [Actinoplanes lutulentus]MBB2943142.1 WD40 repeat protein [Actinoplanes lutulentus]